MRYYTILLNDEEKVAVSADGKTLYVHMISSKDLNIVRKNSTLPNTDTTTGTK